MIPSCSLLASSAPGGGGGGPAVQISNQGVSDTFAGGAYCEYKISANGNVYDQHPTLLETWLNSGVAADYQVRATLLSGSVSGTFGSWLSCASDRTWSLSSSFTVKTGSITVEIRDVATGTVQDSATISFTADASS